MNESSAEKKTRSKTATVKMPPKPQPEAWWHGLSAETAAELQRMGYRSKADAMLFVTQKARFVSRSARGRNLLFDPLHIERPWLRNGMPFRVTRQTYDEIREWLGADPLR